MDNESQEHAIAVEKLLNAVEELKDFGVTALVETCDAHPEVLNDITFAITELESLHTVIQRNINGEDIDEDIPGVNGYYDDEEFPDEEDENLAGFDGDGND